MEISNRFLSQRLLVLQHLLLLQLQMKEAALRCSDQLLSLRCYWRYIFSLELMHWDVYILHLLGNAVNINGWHRCLTKYQNTSRITLSGFKRNSDIMCLLGV